jgi:hypothetical protein
MTLSTVDRNRITVVTIVTLIAVPLLWIASAGSNSGTENTVETRAPTSTIELGISVEIDADAPVNLDGPSVESPSGTGQIAYPAHNDGKLRRGIPSNTRIPVSARSGSATNLIPLGVVITVRNFNNGRKVECTNLNIGYVPPNIDIVLHTDLFEDMAELKEAPLPVELTW